MLSFIFLFVSLQRDVTYDEAKKFADENGKYIIVCVLLLLLIMTVFKCLPFRFTVYGGKCKNVSV